MAPPNEKPNQLPPRESALFKRIVVMELVQISILKNYEIIYLILEMLWAQAVQKRVEMG